MVIELLRSIYELSFRYISKIKNPKLKYLLPTERDVKILEKCKQLEKLRLSNEDKTLVKLIKAQLEDDWRKHLLKKLGLLLRKYKKRTKK